MARTPFIRDTGFLSENARFAQACEEAGFTFIGLRRNRLVDGLEDGKHVAWRRKRGVSIVPGAEGGYPVMLKAVAGGGGKGMRRVDRAEDLASASEAAASEALRAFGMDAFT